MAIVKKANNINVQVTNNYTSLSKVSHEESGEVIIKATQQNLELSSQKKAILQGHGRKSAGENKVALRVLKVEGPFDDKEMKISLMEKDKWYTFKATQFNRKAEEKELKELKWARQYDDSKIVETTDSGAKGSKNISFMVKSATQASKIRIYAYFEKANKDVSAEAKIAQQEVILIVGTEQHSANYGNKMMFPAQAVREIRQNYSAYKNLTILMFTDGYNSEELSNPENSAKAFNANVNFKKINTVTDLINYLNKGDSKVIRGDVKISTIKVFAHGLPSIFDFGLDGKNQLNQRFEIKHISEIKKESFVSSPIIHSFACRTGNLDNRPEASKKGYTYDSNWIELVKPQESLAQKLADYFNATVYAYIKRSEYQSTWDDKDNKAYKNKYIQIEDEDLNGEAHRLHQWDEALWNPQGAYAPPTAGTTPKGLPSQVYKFEKNKKAIPR